jgi:quercetin dioxygenase-like cupin family protein
MSLRIQARPCYTTNEPGKAKGEKTMSTTNDVPFTYINDLLAQLPDIPPDSIVSRTFYSDQSLKAILFGFAAGQELSEHTAARPAILHFLQGEARLTLGDHETTAGPGTWVHMPPHLSHSICAETTVVMLLYLVQA